MKESWDRAKGLSPTPPSFVWLWSMLPIPKRARREVETKDRGIERQGVVMTGRKHDRIAAMKEWYSVEEFARIVRRSAFTCRERCRHCRIHAKKKESGRGAHALWVISHAELLRFQREELLLLGKAI